MEIYPNPADDYIVFESNSEQNYFIFDMNGSLHLTGTLIRGSNIISLNTLAKGTYYINVTSNEHAERVNNILIKM